uniref:MMS1_N domain-containing protein n=1 Tax=Syphacia muris TaxID=451379 RepID=A0A0N5AKM0_9BILA
MPNRHEVVMWDLSVCPYSGSLLTVGGDGNLNLSLSGRLLPHFAEKELNFCASRTLMNLHRKFNMRDIDDNKSGIISSDKKIEINIVLQSYKESLTYSLDIRFESLNRIAISEAKGYIAVCGGEAGLLFFVPF